MQDKSHGENFSLIDFFDSTGDSPLERVSAFSSYYHACNQDGSALYFREIIGPQGPRVTVKDPVSKQNKLMIMMGSNNYLDLANDPEVIEAVVQTARDHGVGMGGPPLLNGMNRLHRSLEQKLAAMKCKGDAMLFASGFQANLGWVTALLRSGDHLIYDELNHASLYDGLKILRGQARVKAQRFAHNDVVELEGLLSRAAATKKQNELIWVVVEGVYSMDGDLAPLDRIAPLCRRYGAYLVVDDAHGSGILGPHGEGTATHFGVEDLVTISMGTFSKAFGVNGGFIAAEQKLVDYMRMFARSYMFSAHLPLTTTAAVLKGIDILKRQPERIARLRDNARYFQAGLNRMGIDAVTGSAIIPVTIPRGFDIRQINKRFHEEGLFMNSIEYPAVGIDDQRLRVSLMSSHSKPDLDLALGIFDRVWSEFGLPRPLSGPNPSPQGSPDPSY